MSQGTNTGIQNPYGQGDFNISTSSTDILRKFLLGKNLNSSYMSDSNPLPAAFGTQQPGTTEYQGLSDNFVINQENVSEVGSNYQKGLFLDNKYGPEGGYTDVQTIDVHKLYTENRFEYVSQNSLLPKSFVASNYTPNEILDTVNISNGVVSTLNNKVLNDSRLAEVSSGYLRENLGYNQSQYLYDVSDKGSASFNVSTSPNSNELKGTDFTSRISNQFYGYSNIPGSYFQSVFVPDINYLVDNGVSISGQLGNITATASALVNQLSGLDNIPTSPMAVPSPSDSFIQHMGMEQQSVLFGSLKYNIYRPDYSRTTLHNGVDNVTPYYYVGSKESEPGLIDSPMGAVPQDEFGRNTGAIVYGPSALAKELETVNGVALWNQYNFGLQGLNTIDGGGIAAGWTWFGHKSFASLNAPPGMLYTRSINKPKRKGGILDETQKLIDSAPLMGGARRKHAGHAIDQTSKIFNDGYKDISKGSGVQHVDDGLFGGVSVNEFCRTWTKDNPYYKMTNLQKYKGNHLGKTDSVLDNTFNLNIAPTIGDDGQVQEVKKFMFSIENLAWRGAPELQDLPTSEKGPNGGRVMWFPPYDINIGDTNSAQWNSVTFLGRPEPIYTYNYTERIGTLSFKMVVDHPSILNDIAQKELKNTSDYVSDKILNGFLAGCKEYDVYDLVKKYPNLSVNDIISTQNDVTSQYQSDPEATMNENNNNVDAAANPSDSETTDTDLTASPTSSTDTDLTASPSENVSEEAQTIQKNTAEVETTKKLDTAKILARLLGEENYFKALKEEDEFVYNSLKRKLQYFHPSFHSMTPEGLNNRLSFLLQCTRPGRTIPTVTEDGVENIDAENTAFGAPPICIMRIGDFYHTKIAIDSVSFSYDPLIFDLNPEGIGVQPMIASVQMNFKYIGGQGLEKPVSQLQNALTNNFFANTEMYNNKSLTQNSIGDNFEIADEEKTILKLESDLANNTDNN